VKAFSLVVLSVAPLIAYEKASETL
jgi:hypothetical protein